MQTSLCKPSMPREALGSTAHRWRAGMRALGARGAARRDDVPQRELHGRVAADVVDDASRTRPRGAAASAVAKRAATAASPASSVSRSSSTTRSPAPARSAVRASAFATWGMLKPYNYLLIS